jgi:hypothetical protein
MSDAERVRGVLAKSGIAAHVADPRADNPLDPCANVIPVSVDNRRLDAARRAITSWRATVSQND